MQALWINMADSVSRRHHMQRLFQYLAIPNERVIAVDTRGWTDEQIDEIAHPSCSRPFSKGIIGNYLSHRKCWEIAASSNNDFTLIFEDDVSICSKTKDKISNIDYFPKDADIIRLECWPSGTWIDRAPSYRDSDISIHRMRSGAFGTAAYAISRKGAERLLESIDTFRIATDVQIYFNMIDDLTIYCSVPGLFTQNQNCLTNSILGSELGHIERQKPTQTIAERLGKIAFKVKDRTRRLPSQRRYRPDMSVYADPFLSE